MNHTITSLKTNGTAVVRGCAVVFFLVVLTWTIFKVSERTIIDEGNRSVELCLDLEETAAVCQLNRYPLEEFLERARTIGVTSAALDEETVLSLENSGAVLSVSKKSGFQSGFPADRGTPEHVLLTKDKRLGDQICRQMQFRYGLAVKDPAGRMSGLLEIPFNAPFSSLSWNKDMPLGFDPGKKDFVERQGLKVVLRPQNAGNPGWLPDALDSSPSAVLFGGKEVPGFGGKESVVAQSLRESNVPLIAMEFTTVAGENAIRRAMADQTILGHTIPVAELERNDNEEYLLRRWLRAVRERGNRFLLVHLRPHRTAEDNLFYARSLARQLKKAGYRLENASPQPYPFHGAAGIRLAAALIVALLIPSLAAVLGTKVRNPFAAYGVFNAASIGGGLLVSAILFDGAFILRAVEIPGIKAVMFGGVFISLFVLLKRERIKKLWHSPVQVKHLFLMGGLAAAAAVIALRSGNTAAHWLQPDQGMRQFFEDVFVVRPRTKELLVGQPLLLLGLYYRKPWLVWLGMIGQASIVNTFLHAHTPVMLSLLRSAHGVWLGCMAGIIALGVIKLYAGKDRRGIP